MTEGFCYIPITISVWKSDVRLFETDCEAKCEWSLPDGPSGPIDWDVTAFWLRKTVEVYRAEPLFSVLYDAFDREWIDTQLREALWADGIVNLYTDAADD